MTRYCNSCGSPVEGNGSFCTNCGAPLYQQSNAYQEPRAYQTQPTGPQPKSYLVLSILATIFCCLPFGIPGIVFAAKVDNLWTSGFYQEAEEASRKAKNWTVASIITGAVVGLAYAVLVFFGAMEASSLF